ncbi:MAG: hypothetical protein ACLP36_04480, partial [Acidimicrobiales bacterium]
RVGHRQAAHRRTPVSAEDALSLPLRFHRLVVAATLARTTVTAEMMTELALRLCRWTEPLAYRSCESAVTLR